MKIETLHDVLYWTRDYHKQISRCLKQCEKKAEAERTRLLLGYLADHEKKLAKVVAKFECDGNLITLNTWVCEYVDRFPVVIRYCDTRLADMSTNEIIQRVYHQHAEIIDLYKHVRIRVKSASAEELLNQLLSLEEHELMHMAQGAGRIDDL